MRISDWSSDVCSSDLAEGKHLGDAGGYRRGTLPDRLQRAGVLRTGLGGAEPLHRHRASQRLHAGNFPHRHHLGRGATPARSEEHTSELKSLMRISYAVFCLKKKKTPTQTQLTDT